MIASSCALEVPHDNSKNVSLPSSTKKDMNVLISPSSSVFSQNTSVSLPLSSNFSGEKKSRMICTITCVEVDEVLTGGYAVDESLSSSPNNLGYLITHLLYPIAEKIALPLLCRVFFISCDALFSFEYFDRT